MKNNEAFILYVQFLLPPWWNVFLFLPLCDLYELCTLPFLVEEIGFSLTVGWTPNLKRKKNLSFFFFYIRRQKKKKRLLRCPRMAQRHGKVASHENKEKRKFYFLYVYIRVTLLRLLHIVPPPPSSWVSCIHEKKIREKPLLCVCYPRLSLNVHLSGVTSRFHLLLSIMSFPFSYCELPSYGALSLTWPQSDATSALTQSVHSIHIHIEKRPAYCAQHSTALRPAYEMKGL